MKRSFLEFTGICGKPFYVKPNSVIGFHEHIRDGKPCVKLILDVGEPYYVVDSIDTIVALFI